MTVFIAAPAALVSGLGMSPALSTRFKRLSKVFSIQVARSLHFLVLVWFLSFIVMHVTMVVATGLLRTLNHMFAARDDNGWVGFVVFAVAMVLCVSCWVAATPFTLRHPRVVQRVGFALIGPVEHLFEHIDSSPGEYAESDISTYFWHNGRYPDSTTYQALAESNFAEYRLRMRPLTGWVIDTTVPRATTCGSCSRSTMPLMGPQETVAALSNATHSALLRPASACVSSAASSLR